MKIQKKKKLNRTIFLVVAFLYSVILILLLVMDISLIRREQEKKTEKEQAVLDTFADGIIQAVDRISLILYDIYRGDSFQYLQKEHDELPEYEAAYEI
ncbi:MAG: hypothetical protein IKN57_14450, partial [Parasporobacterium sp.]|nr:hypothetical protein [Parasporobacterium sp.]